MRTAGLAIALCLAGRGVVACDPTPDLAYGVEDDATVDAEAVDATAERPGDERAALEEPRAGGDGTADARSTTDGPDAGPDVAAVDAQASDACAPFDAEAGVPYGCCPNVGVICVAQSCAHCGDCAGAGCAQTQLCCPTYKGASSNYDTTQCKDQIGACNWR